MLPFSYMGEIINFPGSKKEGSDKNPEAQISAAKTFEELGEVLDAVGRIKGSSEVYSADELVSLIQSVRERGALLTTITRAEGLRDKVAELYIVEQVAKANNIDDMVGAIGIMAHAGFELKDSSGQPYKMQELVEYLNKVYSGELPENYVTRNYGLRQKVVELRDLK